MTTSNARAYICGKQLDDREGSNWYGMEIPTIIYASGLQLISFEVSHKLGEEDLRATVLQCDDDLDALFMSMAHVRRAEA